VGSIIKRVECVIFFVFLCTQTSCGQETKFEKFTSYFPQKNLPYNFENKGCEKIPPELSLPFLCNNDSTLLAWKNVGVDQETSEVVYKILEPYQYKGYAKIKVNDLYLLIYNEYNKDGLNEFTLICNIGIYSNDGVLFDELPFYIYDETGKYIPQVGSITDDYKIIIKKTKNIKNAKGIYTKSYEEITEIYEIDSDSNKFFMSDRNVIIVN
jgi:hypothetical protein